MNQMALGLKLAAAPQIRLGHADAGENVVTGDELVAGDDAAILEREDVECPLELLPAEEERHRGTGPLPVARAWSTGGEILKGQPVDQREGVNPIGVVLRPVRDERLEARPENSLQIGRHGP